MEENSEDSVFSLITNLCETFSSDPCVVKKLRSTAYEVLLRKRTNICTSGFRPLKGPDALCKLLSWQFTLVTQYGLVEEGSKLQEYGQSLKDVYGDGIIEFLLMLRNLPKKSDDYSDFTLPNLFTSIPDIIKEPDIVCDKISDECSSPDIWEVASKQVFNHKKNWEDFGNVEQNKEEFFLSELGNNSHLWVDNLSAEYLCLRNQDQHLEKPIVKSVREFVDDVKHLLVGMASYSFGYNETREFSLLSNIRVNGLTYSLVKSYSDDFILCGNCYKALQGISTLCPESRKYKRDGYIFAEFCQSIQRYLEFYRSAICRISSSMGLSKLHERTKQLRKHLTTLTVICKVGPYTESETMPHGVLLLNYLYKTLLAVNDNSVTLVLNAILFPCCQVYFSRFLQQWILEGNVNDPFEEFFIKVNFKYVSTRGRTYWTRSFSFSEDIIPDFLFDLRMDILNCGKAMNLLKLCVPRNTLCFGVADKRPLIISSCFTYEQLNVLEQNVTTYYLETLSECGNVVNLEDITQRSKIQDPVFMSLIARKRAATLKRIELERRKVLQEEKDKKTEEINSLKEQYDSAMQLKQARIASEIETEIKQIEFNLSIDHLRDKLIKKEAEELINYYNDLYEISDRRRKKIEHHIDSLKTYTLEQPISVEPISSEDSFHSAEDQKEEQKIHSSHSLDVINANNMETIKNTLETFEMARKIKEKVFSETITNVPEEKKYTILDNEKLSDAQRNKMKILSSEFGIEIKSHLKKSLTQCEINRQHILGSNEIFYHKVDNANFLNKEDKMKKSLSLDISTNDTSPMSVDTTPMSDTTSKFSIDTETNSVENETKKLTEAQRNKLKVLSSEFGIQVMPRIPRSLTQSEINRNLVLGSTLMDNANYVNKNTMTEEKSIKKSVSLFLDIPRNEVTPMSTGTTPLSSGTTPLALSVDKLDFESIPATAETQTTDEGFLFEGVPESSYIPTKRNFSDTSQKAFSKRISPEDISTLNTHCLKLLLHESIAIPLAAQKKLAQNELIRYFIYDLHYLTHLSSLRDYFFLQDGEFGRNITEKLFEKLYDAHFPVDLINSRTLENLVFQALQMSSKFQENSNSLSFKINSLPKKFDLRDPDVLSCLSLTYRVKWPLNVLLPIDTISKYDEVFKYLLKLNRISWVLKNIFLELKMLAKVSGKKEIYLMMSPQYRKLHQCRHAMLHFIQTLQNYIVGEVLQPSWENFEKKMASVAGLDSLYSAHTSYIKNILFLCLLNQKSAPFLKLIQKIFVVILKFYEYLRSQSWRCENGTYTHPNFEKLETIFVNFEELLLHVFKMGRKVASSGYQPHLSQLLDMLDANDFYYAKYNVN